MAAPVVTSTITLRSGEKQEFRHQIQSNSGVIPYDKLRESVKAVQKEVNEYLTVQVDRERASNDLSNDDTAEEDEDEENEDEDGANGQGDQEPPPKKPKK